MEDKLYHECQKIIKEELLTNDFYSDTEYDDDIEDVRDKTREYLKTVPVDREDGWWEKPRHQENGKTVVPYESIEDDLYHFYFASSSFYDNRFELGVARIAIAELKFDLSMDYSKEFMTLKKILNIIMTAYGEKDKYDYDLNGLSYDRLYKRYENSLKMEADSMKNRINDKEYERNRNYKIIEVESYEHSQLFKKYTNPDSPWCTTYSQRKYDAYTNHGANKLFYIIYKDFKNIEKPVEPYDKNSNPARWVDYTCIDSDGEIYLPYDEYGLSMILLSVSPDCEICCCASRWNHELGDFSRDFLDEEQLSNLLGVNFYDEFCNPDSDYPIDEKLNNLIDNTELEQEPENILSNSKFDYILDHKENDGEISRYYFDVPECFAHFCLYVYNDEKDVVYLSNLKIDSDHRSHGYGSKLLKDMMSNLHNYSTFEQICIEVDNNKKWLIEWYKHFNFKYIEDSQREGYIWLCKSL